MNDDMGDIVSSDDVRMLVDLGFLALSAGLVPQAEAIFSGVTAARPAQEAGPLGSAMVKLAVSDIDGAIRILRGLPPSDAAQTYLGLALLRRGDVAEARERLSDVCETAAGTPFADLAASALSEAAS